MANPAVTFDSLNINDGSAYSILPDIDLGATEVEFTEYRSYAGTVTQANVSTAKLVQMVIPLKIAGSSVADLGTKIAALDTKIDGCSPAAHKHLVFDGVTYDIVASPHVHPVLTQSYQNKFFVHVDLVLNRLP